MTKNIDIINAAVELIIKAAILAISWGKVRIANQLGLLNIFLSASTVRKEFGTWYNSWRPHMALDGLRPDDVYYDKKPEKPKCDAKTVPCNIEQRFFRQTRITGYRFTKAA